MSLGAEIMAACLKELPEPGPTLAQGNLMSTTRYAVACMSNTVAEAVAYAKGLRSHLATGKKSWMDWDILWPDCRGCGDPRGGFKEGLCYLCGGGHEEQAGRNVEPKTEEPC